VYGLARKNWGCKQCVVAGAGIGFGIRIRDTDGAAPTTSNTSGTEARNDHGVVVGSVQASRLPLESKGTIDRIGIVGASAWGRSVRVDSFD